MLTIVWPSWEQGTEFLKAFAPIAISAAVLWVSVRQNLWQRGHMSREQDLAGQRLRMELLQRRLAVLDAMMGVLARYHVEPGPRETREDSLFGVLIEGRAVFSVGVSDELDALWLEQVAYHNARVSSLEEAGRAEQPKRERAEMMRAALFERLEMLNRRMIAEARIQD